MFDTQVDASLQTAFATMDYVRQISASTASELENRVCYKTSSKKDGFVPSFFTGSPTETRTPDSALRGLRLNRLTMRPRRANAFLSANTRAYLLDFAACRSFSQKIFAAQIFFGSPFFNAPPFSRRNLFWLHYFITIGKVFASVLIQ